MNCTPGDIAIVVSGRNLGLTVEVVCVSQTCGPPHWCVRASRSVVDINPDQTLEWTRIGSIHDARLRPIRPDAPGRAAELPHEDQVLHEVETTA